MPLRNIGEIELLDRMVPKHPPSLPHYTRSHFRLTASRDIQTTRTTTITPNDKKLIHVFT